jgi:phage antirepressor YoqD-like protein
MSKNLHKLLAEASALFTESGKVVPTEQAIQHIEIDNPRAVFGDKYRQAQALTLINAIPTLEALVTELMLLVKRMREAGQ